MRVSTFLGLLLCVSFHWVVWGAATVEVDLTRLNKDQLRQLSQEKTWVSSERSCFRLKNKRESLECSLQTHDETYSEARKAYKRLLIWYIDQRMQALDASTTSEESAE